MLARSQHRFNVTEFYRMAEVGVVKADAKVELLNGQVIDAGRVNLQVIQNLLRVN